MGIDPGFLAQIRLFSQFDDDERAVLAQQMTERSVAADEVLFRAGEPGDAMFIVQTGSVDLWIKDTAGQRISLHTAVSGEHFGELSLLDGGSRTATATVVDAGVLLVVEREDLQQLFRKRPDSALDMLAAMGRMTRKANQLVQTRVSRNVNEQAEVDRGGRVLRVADWVADFSGSITFLVIHVGIFFLWIIFNLGIMPVGDFDPFPFGLLTMAVSLEAIILSTLLLFSSNRQTARDRVRADVEYEINLKAELEVAHLHEKVDRTHEEMLERFARIEKVLLPQVPRSSGAQRVPVTGEPMPPIEGG
ncbi:MAG TPA: DUF1003 domain-containing protein [Kofleriaceae bacterium]|jgi:uncharacterized membrane protein